MIIEAHEFEQGSVNHIDALCYVIWTVGKSDFPVNGLIEFHLQPTFYVFTRIYAGQQLQCSHTDIQREVSKFDEDDG